jgi:F-type H+-transporting ATPase subunit b
LKRIAISIFLFAGAASAFAAEHGESAHGAADNTTLWKLVNFVLLAAVLGYFIYKKGGGFFAARSAEIQRGLVEAARVKADAEARYAEMEHRLKHLGVEVENLRQRTREESAAESARFRAETERSLKAIQVQAEQEIQAAANSARQQLRAYSAELAVGLAAAKIKQRLTPETDKAIVNTMIGEIGNRFAGQAVRVS